MKYKNSPKHYLAKAAFSKTDKERAEYVQAFKTSTYIRIVELRFLYGDTVDEISELDEFNNLEHNELMEFAYDYVHKDISK